MDIYVIQPGDTIHSISNKFGISVEKLVSDNGLINPNALVHGQSIIILYPQKTYIIQEGDTLASIAETNDVSLMQLIRNNPSLYDRQYLYPGESLVIDYSPEKELKVNGFAYAFINRDILKRTLPYLTYISIFNYQIAENASITRYGDETEIIKIAKDYQTQPLLMISAFSPTGELNLDYVYELLISEEKQDKLVNDMLQIVKAKGFYGINALISNITEANQSLYLNVLTKLSKALRKEGYTFFLTLNPNLKKVNDSLVYENLDYKSLSLIADNIIFLQYVWGTYKKPPSPVSDISLLRPFIEGITKIISHNIISIGKPLIGYNWTLPFIPGTSTANSMALDTIIPFAYGLQVAIQFDEESQTPNFEYYSSVVGPPEQHIVWFIDARSIKALNDVIIDYDLAGSGIWNISSFNQQLWSMINASFKITKLPIK